MDSRALFGVSGKTVACISIGDNQVTLLSFGRNITATINGCKIIDSVPRQRFASVAMPVIAHVAKSLSTESKRICIRYCEGTMMKEILPQLDADKQNIMVDVLESKPDEMVENGPKELKTASEYDMAFRLDKYREDLSKFNENMSETVTMASVILRTNPPQSMWGGKKIAKVLSNIAEEASAVTKNKEPFEDYIEMSTRDAEYLMEGFRSPLKASDASMDAAVNRLFDLFSKIKGHMSTASQVFHKIYAVDSSFKESTGYPASWFIDSSILYDFNYGYDNLIKNLIRVSSIESNIMGPLFVWKIKSTGTGAKNVR